MTAKVRLMSFLVLTVLLLVAIMPIISQACLPYDPSDPCAGGQCICPGGETWCGACSCGQCPPVPEFNPVTGIVAISGLGGIALIFRKRLLKK